MSAEMEEDTDVTDVVVDDVNLVSNEEIQEELAWASRNREMQVSPAVLNENSNSMDASTATSVKMADADDESQSQTSSAQSKTTQDKAKEDQTERDFKFASNLAFGVALRKSSRAVTKSKDPSHPRHVATKGKSRRAIVYKKSVYRSPAAFASPMTSRFVFFRGTYFQVGDIVSLTDVDGDKYYAQLNGFLQDQYCEKSAVISWLIPTKHAPEDGSFDPATFVIGPSEELPRKMEYMTFVMHAPSDYFKSNAPFATVPTKPEAGFIWTRLGPLEINRNEIDDFN